MSASGRRGRGWARFSRGSSRRAWGLSSPSSPRRPLLAAASGRTARSRRSRRDRRRPSEAADATHPLLPGAVARGSALLPLLFLTGAGSASSPAGNETELHSSGVLNVAEPVHVGRPRPVDVVAVYVGAVGWHGRLSTVSGEAMLSLPPLKPPRCGRSYAGREKHGRRRGVGREAGGRDLPVRPGPSAARHHRHGLLPGAGRSLHGIPAAGQCYSPRSLRDGWSSGRLSSGQRYLRSTSRSGASFILARWRRIRPRLSNSQFSLPWE